MKNSFIGVRIQIFAQHIRWHDLLNTMQCECMLLPHVKMRCPNVSLRYIDTFKYLPPKNISLSLRNASASESVFPINGSVSVTSVNSTENCVKRLCFLSAYKSGHNIWCLVYIENTKNLDTNHYSHHWIFILGWVRRSKLER